MLLFIDKGETREGTSVEGKISSVLVTLSSRCLPEGQMEMLKSWWKCKSGVREGGTGDRNLENVNV